MIGKGKLEKMDETLRAAHRDCGPGKESRRISELRARVDAMLSRIEGREFNGWAERVTRKNSDAGQQTLAL